MQAKECQHPPIANMAGTIISPRIHYGDGLDGLVECIACKKVWNPKETVVKEE